MTSHPCKGTTKAQRQAFEAIAVSQRPQCAKATLNALIERGLIVKDDGKIRADALGTYSIPSYHVPLHIHMQWCEWCSENVGDEP